MIYIQGKYTTDTEGQLCIEPERPLTAEEQSIVIQIDIFDDVFHYKTIYD